MCCPAEMMRIQRPPCRCGTLESAEWHLYIRMTFACLAFEAMGMYDMYKPICRMDCYNPHDVLCYLPVSGISSSDNVCAALLARL